MKKGINLIWILFAFISLILFIVSCMPCIEGFSPVLFGDDADIINNYHNGHGLLVFTLFPTLFSLLIFLREDKVMNVIGSFLLFLQAIIVTFSDRIYSFIDDILADIGSISYDYNINNTGVIAITLCWILFVISLIFVCKCLMTSNGNITAHQSNIKLISILLTIVFIVISSPLFINYIMMVLYILLALMCGEIPNDMSLLQCVLLLTIVFAISILMIIVSVKKSIITDSRKYLLILVVFIFLVIFIQIIFRHQLMGIWNDMFKSIVYSDVLQSY